MTEDTAENNLSEILNDYLRELDFKVQHPDELMGLSIGFDNLDKRLDGLRNGEVILIGGRPAMGKTTFALNIAYNMASNFYLQEQQNPEDDKCVVFISLELAKKNDLRNGYFQLYQKCRRIKCAIMKTFGKISVKLSLPRASLKNYRFTYMLPNAV